VGRRNFLLFSMLRHILNCLFSCAGCRPKVSATLKDIQNDTLNDTLKDIHEHQERRESDLDEVRFKCREGEHGHGLLVLGILGLLGYQGY